MLCSFSLPIQHFLLLYTHTNLSKRTVLFYFSHSRDLARFCIRSSTCCTISFLGLLAVIRNILYILLTCRFTTQHLYVSRSLACSNHIIHSLSFRIHGNCREVKLARIRSPHASLPGYRIPWAASKLNTLEAQDNTHET